MYEGGYHCHLDHESFIITGILQDLLPYGAG